MNGGFWDKIGNEYERDYVCLQWLRLLGEHVEAVAWEGRGSDEPGVDLWIEHKRERIAVQCKTRSTGQWNASGLRSESFLPKVRKHLDRPDGAGSFVLATNQGAPPLIALRDWAQSTEEPEELLPPAREIATAMGFDVPNEAEALREAGNRIEVDVQTERGLAERIHELAADLAGDGGKRLVSELKALPLKEVLKRELRADELRRMLPPDIRWRGGVDSRLVLEELHCIQCAFVEDALAARRILDPPIERPETERLLGLVQAGPIDRVVLVHGGAGAGKSDVLASVVRDWPMQQSVVVPILADECGRILSGALTIEKLVVATGAGRVTLLIDQLDQLRQAGIESQRRIRDAQRLVRTARRLGCRVIVGCRTVDATKDTQLHKLLRPDGGAPPVELLVGELPEAEVTRVLSDAGVAWNTLGLGVQKLVRQPLCLGIVLGLVEGDGWQGMRSLHELVLAWWEQIAGGNDAKVQAMRALLVKMESDGSFAVDRSLLRDATSIDALVVDGLVQEISGKRVRPTHQALADALLAQELGSCDTVEEILAKLGERERQGVHQARRLRLAASLLSRRDQGGAQLVDELYHSLGIRPLLKRALLLGLADDPLPPSAPLTRIVLSWLDDPAETGLVSGALLLGRGHWVVACRTWMESAWSTSDRGVQNRVLQVLGSVSAQEGDLVAELLGRWTHEDPDTWERAARIFYQDPADDSDALFEMRNQAPGRIGFPQEHPNWKRLIGDNPVRASRTLARRIESVAVEELQDHAEASGYVVPLPDLLSEPDLEVSDRVWRDLRPWWLALPIESLRQIETGSSSFPASPLADCVAIVATCLARLLDEGRLTWDDLLAQLSASWRELDGWLMLEVGARLTGARREPIESAAGWLIENESAVHIHVGWHGRPLDYVLLRPFVRAVAPDLSDDGYCRLERWILEYREQWSSEDERIRMARSSEHGMLMPNEQGMLAYRLLPELPEERRTLVASTRLEEFRRKYDQVSTSPSLEGFSGWLRSSVGDDVARCWPAKEWVQRLREAPLEPKRWSGREDGVAEYTFDTLSDQLVGLVSSNPHQFLPVVRALASAEEPRLERDALHSRLLLSISTTKPPGNVDPTWVATTSDEIEDLLRLPAYFQNDECAIEIGRIVQHRPSHDWSPEVVDRLVEIATVEIPHEPNPVAAVYPRDDAMTLFQWNDAACVAVRALACLATKHEVLHPQLLDVAEELVETDPLARRAVAGVLAMCCDRTDSTRARNLLIRACRDARVAADRECLGAQFWVLGQSDTSGELRNAIVELLSDLPGHDETQVSERGGAAVVELRKRGMIEPSTVSSLLDGRPTARKGAATQLGRILPEGKDEPWILDMAIGLANDDDREVGDTMLRATLSTHNRATWIGTEFGLHLVATTAAKRDQSRILRAFDDEAELTPVVDHVFASAQKLLDKSDEDYSDRPWARFEEARSLGNLLSRLVEELEKTGDLEQRIRALDTWDKLVIARPFEVGALLAELTNPAG